ncbi:DUF6445 family protein [Sphingomonas sp. TREG-RG-20F-R18-01]|uniref:DUF6445 family protein n=1 Tax=Sphingomonas sp. TREG-RG-20F-R18-01 TaxID=2914982 RepID=UPI001F586B31|nr:DUF6445 family protein [Sphingomonas sp. TREG-RG-20F-R18-01]
MSGPRVVARRVGKEAEPVVIIDNFAPDPQALRDFAAGQPFVPAGRHYPGIKAALPPDYMRSQGPLIGKILREVFGVLGKVSVLEADFSIVTAASDQLSIEQCLPHVDALEPGRLALVQYLVPEGTDGTAFYRHRATGFETVDAGRSTAYFASLQRDLAAAEAAPRSYIAGDTALFEQTALVPGVFNRALLYRGRMLHSGAIARDAALPADPARGRLTVTGFFAAA